MLNLISLLGHNNVNASYLGAGGGHNYNYTLTFSNIQLTLQGPPGRQHSQLLKLSAVVIKHRMKVDTVTLRIKEDGKATHVGRCLSSTEILTIWIPF